MNYSIRNATTDATIARFSTSADCLRFITSTDRDLSRMTVFFRDRFVFYAGTAAELKLAVFERACQVVSIDDINTFAKGA